MPCLFSICNVTEMVYSIKFSLNYHFENILLHIVVSALRKIVRNQSKMVQRPFSEASSGNMFWKNFSVPHHMQTGAENMFPGYYQTKTVIHKLQRPKMSTIISSVETGRGKSSMAKMSVNKYANYFPNDLRLARNTLANLSLALEPGVVSFTDNNLQESASTNNYRNDDPLGPREVPAHSKFFPPLDEQGLNNVEHKSNGKESVIVIPESQDEANDTNLLVKSIFMANVDLGVKPIRNLQGESSPDIESEKLDFLIQEKPVFVELSQFSYSPDTFTNPSSCVVLQEASADIDAEEKFTEFNIEVPSLSIIFYTYILPSLNYL